MSSDDLKTSLAAIAWVYRLLPIFVLGILGFSLRHRLRQPLAFVLLGALICFGVTWIVAQFKVYWQLGVMLSSLQNELAATVLFWARLQFAVAMVLSVVPVVWLYCLLAKDAARASPDT